MRLSRQLGVDKAIEPRRRERDVSLIGRDRLPNIRIDATDLGLANRSDARPRVAASAIGNRARALWQPAQVGKSTERGFISIFIMCSHHVSVLRAVTGMLRWTFERTKRLCPMTCLLYTSPSPRD